MVRRSDRPPQHDELRRRGEEALRKDLDSVAAMPVDDSRELAHELRVYQAELEIQNEELRQAQIELEASRDGFAELYDFAPVGYLTLAPDGVILEANLTAATLLGVERAKLLTQNLSGFVCPADRPSLNAHRMRVFSTDAKQTCEAQLDTRGQSPVHVRLESIAAPDDEGVRDRCRTVLVDITERRRLEEFKRELTGIAAHELKSPLTSIVNSLRWIASSGQGLTEAQRNMMGVAVRNSERMMRLIDDILDADRAESGEMSYHKSPIEVMPFVEQALEVNEALGNGVGVTLAVGQGTPGAQVNADPGGLLEVITNLISNAVKFSPAGEVVTLSVTRRGERLRVAVTDRGPGVERELRDRIFEKFVRTHSTDAGRRGSGLGLAISKTIIEAMGGEIGFETADSKGSTFYFELPEWQG